jgi:hypothetical protein
MSDDFDSLYNAYYSLPKPPTEKQVQRGWVKNKPSVVFTMVPPSQKLAHGPKSVIDASKHQNKGMASSISYYALPANAVPTHTHIVWKTQELLNIIEELGWNEQVEDLQSQALRNEEKLAKFMADKQNKFDAKGASLSDKKLKSVDEKIAQCEANLSTLTQAIEKTSSRALDILKKLMGPLKDTIKDIAVEYFDTEVTTSVTRWAVVQIRYMKDVSDTDKLLIPLTEYTGDVDDEEDEDTAEFKRCVIAKLVTQDVTSKPKKDLLAIAAIAYLLLAKKYGWGLAEAQKSFMRNNVKYPQGLTAAAWADLLQRVNKFIPLLTTFKDDEQYKDHPDVHDERNCLSEVEMCSVILGSMPNAIQEAYEVQNPHQKIVTELAPMVQTLDALLKQAKSKREKEQKEKETNPNPTKTSQKKGKAAKKGNGGGKSGGDDASPTKPRDGGCPDCKKKGLAAWWTHGHAGCRFNKNNNRTTSTNTRQLHDHDVKTGNEELFAQFLQWQESGGHKRDHYRHERKRSRSPDRGYRDDYHRSRSYERDRDRDYRSSSRNRGYG